MRPAVAMCLALFLTTSARAQEAQEPPASPPAEPAPTEPEPTAPQEAPAEQPSANPDEAPPKPTRKRPPRKPKKAKAKPEAPPSPAPDAPTPMPASAPDAGNPGAPVILGGPSASAPVPASPPSPAGERAEALETARLFFSYLLSSDLRAALTLATVPFQLEDHRYTSSDELLRDWLRQLREKHLETLTLYGVEVFTAAEMEKKYGKPPERLKALPYREPHAFVAVANVSGRATIAVLRMQPDTSYRVVGFTD